MVTIDDKVSIDGRFYAMGSWNNLSFQSDFIILTRIETNIEFLLFDYSKCVKICAKRQNLP